MLTFILWVLIIVNALNAALTALIVGKPRKPVTPGNAAVTILMSCVMVGAAVYALVTPNTFC